MTSASSRRPRAFGAGELAVVALFVLAIAQHRLAGVFDHARVQTWATVFVSITVQALPFLVLGVIVSAAIAAWVSPAVLARVLPSRQTAAVPVAGLAGVALPGCECGSVPVAGRLIERGVPTAAAVTFLLAAPAINPVVVVATLVAFPGQPEMALARFVASLVTAVVVGWVWIRVGRDDWLPTARTSPPDARPTADLATFRDAAVHDLLHAGGYLVLGAATAATLQVLIGRDALDAVADSGIGAIFAMAALAVILSVCSEADAFVAAGLRNFSLTSRLVFLVVGPMVDLKLVALQVAFLGRRFTLRFAPLTLVVAIVVATVVGEVLL
jgi:uncharacterized membrane protein YraQ (UPF0718 family)